MFRVVLLIYGGRIVTCCFDGYTNYELSYKCKEDYDKLKQTLIAVIEDMIKKNYLHYLCGFDRGCDLLFAECLIELKEKYPEITLESILPFEEQAALWSDDERELYYNLLSKCDHEVLLRTQYQKGCYTVRDKFMVKKSDMLITIYDGKLSCTMQTVLFAKQQYKKIIYINPITYNITQHNQCSTIFKRIKNIT